MNISMYPEGTPDCVEESHELANCTIGLECINCGLVLNKKDALEHLKQNKAWLEDAMDRNGNFMRFIQNPYHIFAGSLRKEK